MKSKSDKMASFFNLDLPCVVPPSQRQSLVTDFNKVPIVTESIAVEDGFYFLEPTLNDILKLKAKIIENDPNTDDGMAYGLIVQYAVKNMTNIDFDDGNISLKLLGEVQEFLRDKLFAGFFYSEVLSNTQSKKQEIDTTGTTEESV